MRSRFPRWPFAAGVSAAVLFTAACATTPQSGPSTPAGTRHVRLLHIADTHAQLEAHPEFMPGRSDFPLMGGYARLKTLVDRQRSSARGAVFFADGGDTFQGSGPAAWSEGQAVLGPLNALGLDVCVPGNWEVVYGPRVFRQLMDQVTCKVLSWNFHDSSTGERLFAPSVVLERAGVKVAFVGIADPTTTRRQPPATVKGLDSTRMEGLREHVASLRKQADLVVAVTHTGLTVSRQLAREIPELDVVLSGHTHERTETILREGRVLIVEPGSLGSFLGQLDLELAADGSVSNARFALLPVEHSLPEEPTVKAEIEKSLAPHRARMQQAVGETTTALLRYDVLETTADNFIADALREVTRADIAATNGFRFSPPIPAGPLTEHHLWLLLPLDARLKKGWVTGSELQAYLERELELVFSKDAWKLSGGWGPRLSGVRFSFEAFAPEGHRLRSVSVNGRPVEPSAHYSFAGCERDGEKLDIVCRFEGVHDVEVLPLTVHQALGQYLKAHPRISPARDGREVAVDLPARVFSQDQTLQSSTAKAAPR